MKRQGRERRQQERVALERPIRVRYRLFQEFIEEMSANISTGGMFIATDEPREPGSQFNVEFSLEDGFTFIEGRVEVAWIRSETAGTARPAGMGVRFLDLEETGQALVAKIVDRVRTRGRKPFDIASEAQPRTGQGM